MKNFTKIVGLSDNVRMPRLGKIRLGAKLQKKKDDGDVTDYPCELPFFLLPPEVAEVYGGELVSVEKAKEAGCTRGDAIAFINKNIKNMALELPIMIPLEDIDLVFPQAYKMYGQSIGLKCIGNGEEASQRVGNTTEWEDKKCPCDYMDKKCSRVAHLMVVLPGVSMGGVYQIDIGGINSIIDINSALRPDGWVSLLFGRISMVPLILRRVPIETHHDGKKQIHFGVQIIADYTADQINLIAGDSQKIITHQKMKKLEAPVYSDPKNDAVDMVVEQSEEAKAMVADLQKLGAEKKITRKEAKAVKTAIDSNDDDELKTVYDDIKARLKGKATSAEDLERTLKNQVPDKPKTTPPPPKQGNDKKFDDKIMF